MESSTRDEVRRWAPFVVWLLLVGATVFGTLRIGAIAQTVSLQFALDADGVANALKGEEVAAVREALAWDFVLPFLYMPLLIIWVGYARRSFYVIPAAQEFGGSLIFATVVAGVSDWAENALHLSLLSGVDSFAAAGQWQAVWASSFALVKWVGLALTIAYVLPATIWTIWLMLSRLLPWQVSVQDLTAPRERDNG